MIVKNKNDAIRTMRIIVILAVFTSLSRTELLQYRRIREKVMYEPLLLACDFKFNFYHSF